MKNHLQLIPKINFYKSGSKIHIKKQNRGKFTEYCGGKVTEECIQRGKNSPDPKIRKRATFAANARKFKHQQGGSLMNVPSAMGNYLEWQRQQSEAAYQQILEDSNQENAKIKEQKEKRKPKPDWSGLGKLFGQGLSAVVGKKSTDGNVTNSTDSPSNDPVGDSAENKKTDLVKSELFKVEDPNKKITDAFIQKNNLVPTLKPMIGGKLPQLQTPSLKKGKKLFNKHQTHGWTSILDDTGKVSKKTLKLK